MEGAYRIGIRWNLILQFRIHGETDDGPADGSEYCDPMKEGPKPRVAGVAAAREEEVADVEEIHRQNCRFKIWWSGNQKRLPTPFVVEVYLPTQKVEKIRPSTSSGVMSPASCDSSFSARRIEAAVSSG